MGSPAYSGDGIAIEYDSFCLSGYQFGGGGTLFNPVYRIPVSSLGSNACLVNFNVTRSIMNGQLIFDKR